MMRTLQKMLVLAALAVRYSHVVSGQSDLRLVSPSDNATQAAIPSPKPTQGPSMASPSNVSTIGTSNKPSSLRIVTPTMAPSKGPNLGIMATSRPTGRPSQFPTGRPSSSPTHNPTGKPSNQPSNKPKQSPQPEPAEHPTSIPSESSATTNSTGDDDVPFAFDAPFQEFYAALHGYPSITPSAMPSKQQTLQPNTEPSQHPRKKSTPKPSLQSRQATSSHPSMQPSATWSTAPTQSLRSKPTQRASAEPSTLLSKQPSTSPSELPSAKPSVQSKQPSSQPSILPSTTWSVDPTYSPSITPTKEPFLRTTSSPSSRFEHSRHPPSLRPTIVVEPEAAEINQGPSSAPKVQSISPTTGPTKQYMVSTALRSKVSIVAEGIPELMDQKSKLLLESVITQFLSERVTEMQGVSIFFLKTEVLSQNYVSGNGNQVVVKVEANVQAVAVGGSIDKHVFSNRIKLFLEENLGELEERIVSDLESFSGSLTGNVDVNVESSDGSSKNLVILVAVIGSAMIGMLLLGVGCIAIARQKENSQDMIKLTDSQVHTQPTMRSRPSMDGESQHRMATDSRKVPITQDSESFYSDTVIVGESNYGKSRGNCYNTATPQSTEIEPKFPQSISPFYNSPVGMKNPPSQDAADNIELVGIIEDEDGSWIGTKIAAITGGRDTVQKAEMLCHVKCEDFANNVAGTDSVGGGTSALSDIAMYGAPSQDLKLVKAKTQATPRSRSASLPVLRKTRTQIEKVGKGAQSQSAAPRSFMHSTQEDLANIGRHEALPPIRSRTQRTSSASRYQRKSRPADTLTIRSPIDDTSDYSSSNGQISGASLLPMVSRLSSTSASLSDRHSLSTSDSRSPGSGSSGSVSCSVSHASDSFSYESYSQVSASPKKDRESFLLKLKETVSTAACSRTQPKDKTDWADQAYYVRKMTTSTSSGRM